MTARGGDQVIPRPRDWRPGRTASWQGRTLPLLGVADVEARLARYEPVDIVRGPPVDRAPAQGPASAVLVALYDGPDGATTILTKRPAHMRKHAGEIAFPGGAIDDTDADPWAAAVREAHEEVGIEPSAVEVMGFLDPIHTVEFTLFVVPVVGWMHSRPEFVPSEREVAKLLEPTLEELTDEDRWRFEVWRDHRVWFYDIDGEVLWGATAYMTRLLLGLET